MPERRRYFRISDYVELDYQALDTDQLDTRQLERLFPDAGLLSLQAELKKIDTESSQLLYQIKDRDRPLGDYLQLINRKIELVSQQIVAKGESPKNRAHREISLSEGGVAFTGEEALAPGQFLALHLLFLPSYAGVILLSEVARCEPCRNDQFEIAANFHQPTSAQKQVLSQQIMRAQLAEKRRHLQENS